MKTILLSLATAIGLSAISATAQDVGVPSGAVIHSYVGYVTEMVPEKNTIQVAKDADSSPVVFVYSDDTRFVDAQGERADKNAISTTTLVKVDYSLIDDLQQVRQIVVNPTNNLLPTTTSPVSPAE